MTTNELPAAVIAADLADARYRCACARARFEKAKSKKDRQFAAEDIAFYGDKAAYLSAWLAKRAA